MSEVSFSSVIFKLMIRLFSVVVFSVIIAAAHYWLSRHRVEDPDDTTENWLSHLSDTSESRRASGSAVSGNTDYRLSVSGWRESYDTTDGPSAARDMRDEHVAHDDALYYKEDCPFFYKEICPLCNSFPLCNGMTDRKFSESSVIDGPCVRRRESANCESSNVDWCIDF